MSKNVIAVPCLAIIGIMVAVGAAAQGGPLLVAGSAGYDPASSTGSKNGTLPFAPGSTVNNNGTAVGQSYEYINGVSKGPRGVRWSMSGPCEELGTLPGSSTDGSSFSVAYAVNDSGVAVGCSDWYSNNNGSRLGLYAVRWDATSATPTALDFVGPDWLRYEDARAYDINNAGTAVGFSDKVVGGHRKGTRAVRWDASGTAATELGGLGMDSSGTAYAQAYAINDSGTIVGYAAEYYPGVDGYGIRAVRWDASSTIATKLQGLGADAYACAANDSGTAVGWAEKYTPGNLQGFRAVRWDSSGTASTELGNLGTNSSGTTTAKAYALNNAGAVAGYSQKYVNGVYLGDRAVRWDASDPDAIELASLGTDVSGTTSACAYAINSAGAAVGYSYKYVDGTSVGKRAVLWLPDASAIDLNDLGVAPAAGAGTWTLKVAQSISADGWVAGEGTFDPDGSGPLASYARLWVAQVGLGGTWTSATGGTWGRGPNWSTGTPAMQVGSATFSLSSAYAVTLDRNELTKTIAVDAGTVTIAANGHTLSTESGLSVAAGAMLKAAGTIGGAVLNSGTLAPGDGVATLNIDGTLTNTGTLKLDIAGHSLFDRINVSSTLALGGTIEVDLDGYVPALGDTFNLMGFGAFTDNGYVFDFSEAGLPAGLAWSTASFATTGSIEVVVPEPGTLGLLGVAALGLLVCIRRRRP
jgi:hypothetical protein